MVEPVLEPREAEEAKETLHATNVEVRVVRGEARITASILVPGSPQEEEATSEDFTQASFEDALDMVSRPVKGKYADMLPSSEEFIGGKRREIELEDRPS